MSLTNRQHDILDRICALEVRTKRSGRRGYCLDGNDVTTTINSLLVRKLVMKEADGRRLVLTNAGQSALGVFAT